MIRWGRTAPLPRLLPRRALRGGSSGGSISPFGRKPSSGLTGRRSHHGLVLEGAALGPRSVPHGGGPVPSQGLLWPRDQGKAPGSWVVLMTLPIAPLSPPPPPLSSSPSHPSPFQPPSHSLPFPLPPLFVLSPPHPPSLSPNSTQAPETSAQAPHRVSLSPEDCCHLTGAPWTSIPSPPPFRGEEPDLRELWVLEGQGRGRLLSPQSLGRQPPRDRGPAPQS